MSMTQTQQHNVPTLRFSEFSGDWKKKLLGSFCEFTQGVQIPLSEQVKHKQENYIRYLYIRDFFTDKFPYYVENKYPNKIIQKNEIMVVNTGNTAGKAFKGKRGVLSNNSFKISFNEKSVDSNYLFASITSDERQRRIRRFFNSGGQPHLGHKNIALVLIGLPTLPEQQKIAAFLASVDRKIAQLGQKKALLQRYKKGMMEKLFSQELRFKDAQSHDFPDWEEKKLGEIAERCTLKNSIEKHTRVLTNSAVRGVIDQGDYFDHAVANADNLGGYYIVEMGDFVYNPRISVSAPVGPIKRNDLGVGVMSPLYSVFRFNSEDTEFYEQYYSSSFWHRYMKSVANYGARHDRMAISTKDFMNMPLPNPCPEEQQKIADFLSSIDRKIDFVSTALDHAKTFKKGLLQQMFI